MALRSFMAGVKLPFRRRSLASTDGKPTAELSIPFHFRCPISLDLMQDPVTLPTGITYDRQNIEAWLEGGNCTCPVTNQPFAFGAAGDELIPNHAIRRMIQDWCVAHRSHGIERIPTPKIPVTRAQIEEVLSEIAASCWRSDEARCLELVKKVKAWAAESDRNRRSISSNRAASGVLAAAFRRFPTEEILSALAGISPLNEEARQHLGSSESLKSIVFILRNGKISGRLYAILLVKDLAAETEQAEELARMEGLVEAVAAMVKEPISLQAAKASLAAAYYLSSSSWMTAARLVEMGLVPAVLEMLVDSEKSLCEKALGMLVEMLRTELGRKRAACHSLTVPVLVKKMFRVSDTATELAVSALWKLCRTNGGCGGETGETCAKEAMQFGAFQKLLLLLQVGCSESTKEKATELLRVMKGTNGAEECIESMDLRGIKRQI
ncbi:U-box domain-containing protein 20 [Apostasia shenzhenica]|uniref:U-box domain-containing protein n=1 Tax=Apostasia shenzhenica TaxID=1088818 RepID=A0A2H9ZRZ4_9ASPA|nr:U-box domain-containing protein 20 [Apostasia shenzhenica]